MLIFLVSYRKGGRDQLTPRITDEERGKKTYNGPFDHAMLDHQVPQKRGMRLAHVRVVFLLAHAGLAAAEDGPAE